MRNSIASNTFGNGTTEVIDEYCITGDMIGVSVTQVTREHGPSCSVADIACEQTSLIRLLGGDDETGITWSSTRHGGMFKARAGTPFSMRKLSGKTR